MHRKNSSLEKLVDAPSLSFVKRQITNPHVHGEYNDRYRKDGTRMIFRYQGSHMCMLQGLPNNNCNFGSRNIAYFLLKYVAEILYILAREAIADFMWLMRRNITPFLPR